VQAIITLAHGLRCASSPKGVEREDQLEFLRGLGNDEYQGYLYSKALAGRESERRSAREDAGGPTRTAMTGLPGFGRLGAFSSREARLPLVLEQETLAQADRLRRDFHQLVVLDELHATRA
jgi:hypothetical protein